jgi:hypothetical protein
MGGNSYLRCKYRNVSFYGTMRISYNVLSTVNYYRKE